MLKGGVIMDVTNVEEARIAEEAGAVAVMALERVPADIRRDGGVARMSDPTMIKAIKVRGREATESIDHTSLSEDCSGIRRMLRLCEANFCPATTTGSHHHPRHGQITHWALC